MGKVDTETAQGAFLRKLGLSRDFPIDRTFECGQLRSHVNEKMLVVLL